MLAKKIISLSFLLFLGNTYLSAMYQSYIGVMMACNSNYTYNSDSLDAIKRLDNGNYVKRHNKNNTCCKIKYNKDQTKTMDFFRCLYCSVTNIHNKNEYNSNFIFLGKNIIEIRVPNKKIIVIVTNIKKSYENHFNVSVKENESATAIAINMNSFPACNQQKMITNFKILQTLNKSQ